MIRQHHCQHRWSKLKIGDTEITPVEKMPNTMIYAIRIYKGGPYTAVVHHAYFMHYGSHRINLSQDGELGEAVYAYTDLRTALTALDLAVTENRRSCLGLIQGSLYGKSNPKARISPDSRTF